MRATIRTKLITIFTLVVVVPVTLVGVEAYMISRRTLTSHISQGLERQAVGAVDQIDRVLFERYQNVKSWSADAIMLGVTEGDRDGRISNFLSTMQQQYGLYAGLVCVDANGRIVAASHPRLIGMDVADAPWFHPAREDPAVHVYDLAFSELFGGVSLVFAAPIRPAAPAASSAVDVETVSADPEGAAGPPLGVLAAALNWSEILTLVNTMPILEMAEQTQAAYAILIDRLGQALTQPFFDDREIMLARNLIEDGLGAARPPAAQPTGFRLVSDLYGHSALMGFAMSRGYRDFKGLGWSVLVFQRSAEAFQPIRTLQEHILLSSLLVVALVILVSTILTRKLTTPIVQMARVAERVARGDFEERVTLVPGDEVGSLATVFNQMIADLKQQRAQLVERAFVDNVIGSMLNSLIVADPDGNIRTVNGATCALLGYSEQELLGQPLAGVVDGTVLSGGEHRGQHNIEMVYRTKDARRLPVLFSSALLRGRDGRLQGVVCVAQDLTDRKRAEEAMRAYAQELARSNAELEQFAYVASHDLQEPLRMVASYTQLLARRYKGRLDADADEFIGFAVDAATRMQRLINDLLAYSRVGTRGKPFEPTNLSEVVDQVLATLKLAIEEGGARVTRDPLPTVMADATQMGQLFQNLIGNAIKFRKKDTPLHIHVSVAPHGREWRVEVADNGIGFEPAYAERIFVIFQRLHTVAEYPGTGIGLAICKKIVERHRGRIWADASPGRGSTFSFTLPLEPPAEQHV